MANSQQFTANLVKNGRQLANKVLFLQLIICAVFALFCFVFFTKSTGLSAIYGGLTALVPNTLFSVFAFKYGGARQNKQVVRSFSKGAKYKLLLTIGFFVTAFAVLKVEPLPLLGCFAVTTVGQWSSAFFGRK